MDVCELTINNMLILCARSNTVRDYGMKQDLSTILWFDYLTLTLQNVICLMRYRLT